MRGNLYQIHTYYVVSEIIVTLLDLLQLTLEYLPEDSKINKGPKILYVNTDSFIYLDKHVSSLSD